MRQCPFFDDCVCSRLLILDLVLAAQLPGPNWIPYHAVSHRIAIASHLGEGHNGQRRAQEDPFVL